MNYITFIGLFAGFFTTISSLPQAIKIIRTKQTHDLSLIMYISLTTGLFLWFLYGIFLKDIAIALTNGITVIFTFTILIMIIRYK